MTPQQLSVRRYCTGDFFFSKMKWRDFSPNFLILFFLSVSVVDPSFQAVTVGSANTIDQSNHLECMKIPYLPNIALTKHFFELLKIPEQFDIYHWCINSFFTVSTNNWILYILFCSMGRPAQLDPLVLLLFWPFRTENKWSRILGWGTRR